MNAADPGCTFWGLGGDHMIKQGLEALHHANDLSVTGFIEVIKHLAYFKQVMADVISACQKRKPDAAILIDYPGFNIRLGVKLKAMGIPVYYYISPQVWAWKKGRVKTMKTFISRMFVIFPFEEHFYRDHGIPVTFAGHPLVEKNFDILEKDEFYAKTGLNPGKPLVALLPGSRRNELERLADPLVDSVIHLKARHPELQFAVAGLSSLDKRYYQAFEVFDDIPVLEDQTYSLAAYADAAIVASGTASLEVAYLGTPLVVVYRIALLSYIIGKILVHIEHLAMPNLILSERAVPELIQGYANGPTIAKEIDRLLTDDSSRSDMVNKLSTLKDRLGNPGCAGVVANTILKEIR